MSASSLPAPAPPPPPPPVGSEEAPDVSQSAQPTEDGGWKLKFCTVCASNNNRSMEAHLRLAKADYPVISFGTGSLVRLPGPSISEPNVYEFNITSYDQMWRELNEKDSRLYKANGVLNMLDRNRGVKFGPERFAAWVPGQPRLEHYKNDLGASGTEGGIVDVIVTCEERCWDAVCSDLQERGGVLNKPVHVVNVEIKDNHEEALVGGRAILDLADALNKAALEDRNKVGSGAWDVGSRGDFDTHVMDLLSEWQDRWPKLPLLYTLSFL